MVILSRTVSFHEQIVELLRKEAEAITCAAGKLRAAEVERAVQLMIDCRGKIVLLGVGKSGIIAQKIAATMTSTGTAAVFLHPSDALHGGLGLVQRDDMVVVLSNSGETDELIALIPSLRRRGLSIVAVVGNANSTLARQADVVLDAAVDEEACPLNLAPTTSTTVALAIGDALAMTLMRVKGHTPEMFAANHPAGRLGKRLTLRVADLMHRGDFNPVILADVTWLGVVKAISDGGLGAVSVVDSEGHLLGIITDGDLRRALQRIAPTGYDSLRGEAIMTHKPVKVTADVLAYDALRLMEDRPSQISVLPVVDGENRSIGLIRVHDIIRSGL